MIRSLRWFWQRITRGWDDREIWSLDHTFADWIVPRLELLKEKKHGVPISCIPNDAATEEDHAIGLAVWEDKLDAMILGFKMKQDEWNPDGWFFGAPPEEYEYAKKLFAQHLDDLWD